MSVFDLGHAVCGQSSSSRDKHSGPPGLMPDVLSEFAGTGRFLVGTTCFHVL